MQDVVRRGEGGREGEASVSDFYGNILPNAAAAAIIAPFLISAGRPVVAPSLLFAETTRQSPFSNLRGEEEKERESENEKEKEEGCQ